MKLAKVIGTVVASQKHESVMNTKMLVIQPLTDELKDDGGPIVAIDTAKAGPNDLVYWVLARESSLALDEPFAPVDAAIVGIVDQVNSENKGIVDKERIFEIRKS